LGLLLAILLLSFALRVYRLGDQNVWWDEGWSVSLARQPVAELLRLSAGDVHPPGYYLLLHLWRNAAGDSEFSLRFLSTAAGVLAVAATYVLGRAVGGVRAGLLAALMLGLSRFHVWWSQEMRMYALGALFVVISVWAAVHLWDRGRKADWLAYVACTVAGLYTLYLSALAIVVLNLVWLGASWRKRPRRPLVWRWLSAQAAVILLFIPWLVYALQHVPTWSSASPVSPRLFPEIYWSFLAAGIPADVQNYRWLTLPLLGIFLAGVLGVLWVGRRRLHTKRNVVLLLLLLLLPACLVYLGSLPRAGFLYAPQLSPRYLLIFASAYAVLLGWGLACLWRSLTPVGALLTMGVVAAAGFSLSGYYPGRVLTDDYRSLASTLKAYVQPGDAVVLDNDQDWPIFAYHYPGQWVGIPHGQAIGPKAAAAFLSPVWESHDGLWLVLTPYAGVNDPGGEIPHWLQANAATIVEIRLDDKVLRLYTRNGQRAATSGLLVPDSGPSHPFAVAASPGLRLVGYDQMVREARGGDTLHLFLYWLADERGNSPQSGAIELSLLDRNGREWQRCTVPWPSMLTVGDMVRQQMELPLPPDAPPGTYHWAIHSPSVGEGIPLGQLKLLPSTYTSVALSQLTIAYPLGAMFAGGIRLLGYDVGTRTLQPGDAFAVTLYWQAQQPVGRRYKVFAHLLGQKFNPRSGNLLWGQQDNEPVNGTRPTSAWRTGEVIVDGYSIPLDLGAPPGEYGVEVGLYDPATGERVPVIDGAGNTTADHLILAHVTVSGGQ
jgi:4-amino-4-deoxy-L-arabinose transferase-like glycosyltransferase